MRFYFISPLLLQKLIWIPTRFILWVFGRLEVRGLENLNGIKTPVIFAPNHPSELDPFLVPASLPFWSHFSPLFYTTREKAFYDTVGWRKHFFGGLFIKMWGGYPVSVGLRDYEKAMPHHIRLAKAGVSFCFFPEGGRTLDGTIHPAKGGVAFLAEYANYSIVPVGISGAFKMSASDFFFMRRKLVVHFGPVISQDDLQSGSVKTTGNIYKQRGEYVLARVKELVDLEPTGAVQVERKDLFDEMEIERLWEIYDKAFEPINKISPCKQSFDRVHFIETLHDPTVRKYVLAKEKIGLVGIGFITNDLKNTPWISEDYFKTNFPKEHGRKVLYYFMGLAIHDDFRGNKYSLRLLEHIIEDLPADVVMGFDHSRNVNPLLHHFTRIVRQAGEIRRSRIDQQHYHVVRRKE